MTERENHEDRRKVIGVYFSKQSGGPMADKDELSRLNFVNIAFYRKSSDILVNNKSEVFSEVGIPYGTLITNIIDNLEVNELGNTSFINSEQTLYLIDGIVKFNVSRKYSPIDIPNFDKIITKPVFTSGRYLEYIDNLYVEIEGINLGKDGILFKYTLIVKH
jgi:hypothetical protein